MLEIRERLSGGEPDLTLTLPFEERQRSRALVVLGNGEEAALLLARGSVLRGGDLLALSDGRIVVVRAADEVVSTAYSDDARALMRAAYHLGNRHVPVQIGNGFVRYARDHVLDGMVRELGLTPREEEAGFEPEGGAFARRHVHGHVHGQSQEHDHVHDHDHDHDHDHVHEDAHAHEHDHVHEDAHEYPHRDEIEGGPRGPVSHADSGIGSAIATRTGHGHGTGSGSGHGHGHGSGHGSRLREFP